MKNIFGIENFNVIEDEDNIYFFRALNREDTKDIEDGKIINENGEYIRIRTGRERYEEDPEKEEHKYKKEDEISLKQVHDHVKMRYRRDTNCISLSSNANVSIDYGRRVYNDKYIMIKVPKKEIGEKVIFTGKYILEEIEKRLNEYISSLDMNDEKNKKIREEIEQIENAKTSEEIKKIINITYKSKEPINTTKSMMKQGIKYSAPTQRISKYQALSEDQNLEKNKIIGKLTLLERKAGMENLVPYVSNNKIIESVGNSFASMESAYYGDIPGEDIKNVPSIVMDMFSLVQQIDEKNIQGIEEIKKEFIKVVNQEREIEILEDSILYKDYDLKAEFTIEEMYKLTNGRIEFGMANSIIKNMYYLAKSQIRAKEIASILNELIGNNPKYQQIIEYIANNGFRVEADNTIRQSNKGYKISESVNLD